MAKQSNPLPPRTSDEKEGIAALGTNNPPTTASVAYVRPTPPLTPPPPPKKES